MTVFSAQASTKQNAKSELDLPLYVDGKITTLGELAHGRPSVLIFWAVNCQFCKQEIPAVNALYSEFNTEALILAVNIDQNMASIAQIPKYIEEYNLRVNVIQDPREVVSRHFSVPGTPTAIVIDKNGHVRKKTHRELSKLSEVIPLLL